MRDPRELYELDADSPAEGGLDAPVLVHVLSGFVDAGHAGRLAAESLLGSLSHRVVARFDIDQLYDYRARRPAMTFSGDHWESYDAPALELRLVTDASDRPFLLLTGPEPDLQWERFVAAVGQLVDRYGVRLTVGLHAIPMAVPHTRPVSVIAHGTDPGLISGHSPWTGQVQVPGNVTGLIELRLGEKGEDAVGFAVQVPHYLTQTEWPDAAMALLGSVGRLAGLDLPTGELEASAVEVRKAVGEQVGKQPEVEAVVRALEEQYDTFAGRPERSLLAADTAELPTADELGAELERFLAEENERRGREG